MASVPYDVLVEILEWLIEPEQDEVSKLKALWPFEVPFHSPPLRSSGAQIPLRACCPVCQRWRAVAQPILQGHLCWNSPAGKAAGENRLEIGGVTSSGSSIEAAHRY